MRVILFFSYGVSLRDWKNSGLFDREVKIYRNLANNKNLKITFITYGDEEDLQYENEIPEIEDEIIEVKAVKRTPGDRSKIVVYSSDRRVDAVGACVGMKGSRIQSIVRELNGEKIDIINWSDKPEIHISRALAPAKPINAIFLVFGHRFFISLGKILIAFLPITIE